jgi:hypothetical protein
MTEHCQRFDILRWAREGRIDNADARAHLAECSDCAQLWNTARAFAGAHTVRLANAPSGWVERAIAIGQRRTVTERLKSAVATLVSDSWTAPAAVSLRGIRDTDARRLRWEAHPWALEVRAESSPQGWELVAQVQRNGAAVPGLEVQFNNARTHSDASGMATWSGKRPPRKITLHTDDGPIVFEDVRWSRPKKI